VLQTEFVWPNAWPVGQSVNLMRNVKRRLGLFA
jgi:hypothetical protein